MNCSIILFIGEVTVELPYFSAQTGTSGVSLLSVAMIFCSISYFSTLKYIDMLPQRFLLLFYYVIITKLQTPQESSHTPVLNYTIY